ncbi:MAG: UvrD-helicase domain-containing protein [Planctomycetes bacterium]|nr:UvrD-helicase domain-containing protein [Planctomycetota bacterium]
MADPLADLTEAQREAVTHVDGPLLIIAGAGSGKTRVITRRIAYLLSRGVRPWNLCAITFTNKAAGEMRERVEALAPGVQDLRVATFHSFAARMLRRDAARLGHTSDFSIYDTGDKAALIAEAMDELRLDPKSWRPGQLSALISRHKDRLYTPDHAEEEAVSHLDRTVASVYRRYQESLVARNAMDFDDILVNAVRLLEEHPEVLDHYRERLRHVLVDEYQDTNHPQYRLVNLLASRHRNLCVVGDEDQAIYSWRGADIRNILDFERDFPECKVVRLERNYRSTRSILEVAQSLIRNNTQRKEKALYTENDEGEPVRLMVCGSERDEAVAVAREVEALVADGAASPEEVAVFYRVNALSRNFETALRERGLPYQIVGGVEFYQRKEVKDLLAYLRLSVNPRDDTAFLRAVNTPPRRVGKQAITALREEAARRGVPLLEAARGAPIATSGALRGAARRGVQGFLAVLAALEATPAGTPAEVLVRQVTRDTGYEGWISGVDEQGEERLENVRELASAAALYDQREPQGGLRGFLEQVALVTDADGYEGGTGRVTLMTLHAAKGLEFPVVFMAGMEEGLLPHSRSADDPDAVEEERRLCYVGMTRARRRLYLSRSMRRTTFGQSYRNLPSRFLEELPRGRVQASEAAWRAVWTDTAYGLRDGGGEAGPARPGANGSPYRPGDRVGHEYFGEGAVVSCSGSGLQTRVRVRFPRHGEKQFVLHYVRLERL